MSNPDGLVNSQVPTPEMPTAPEEPLVPEEEETVEARAAEQDSSDGVFPADVAQPETQGDDPLEAELGDDGQGDLAPEDEGAQHSGDAPTDLRTAE